MSEHRPTSPCSGGLRPSPISSSLTPEITAQEFTRPETVNAPDSAAVTSPVPTALPSATPGITTSPVLATTTAVLQRLQQAGQEFLSAIEHAGDLTLTAQQHLELLDEITEWLIRAQCAHDQLWNSYYTQVGERMAAANPRDQPSAEETSS